MSDLPTGELAGLPVPEEKMAAARLAGHSWDAINGYLSQRTGEALSAGHSQEAVDAHLGYPDQRNINDNFEWQWSGRLAQHEDLAKAVAAPETLLTPEARHDYADALSAGWSGSPREFAQRYLDKAATLAAGQQPKGGAPLEVGDTDKMIAALPTTPDVLDFASAVVKSAGQELTSANVNIAKKNILDTWAETGQSPSDQYRQSSIDDEFKASLVNPKSPPAPTIWDTLADLDRTQYESKIAGANAVLDIIDPGRVARQQIPGAVKDFAESIIGGGELAILGAVNLFRMAGYGEMSAAGIPTPPFQAITAHPDQINPAVLGGFLDFVTGGFAGPFRLSDGVVADSVLRAARREYQAVLQAGKEEAITSLSAQALAKQAEELGPVHVEAARISSLAADAREGELAKLEVPMTPEGEAGAAVERKAVEDLLPAYDAAAGFYKHAYSLIGDILGDEGGALSLYHGTGVNFAAERGAPFGRFQLEKVGAGEGAQLYSYGLYFAQDARVSEWYKAMDVRRKGVPTSDGSLYTVHVDVNPETQMLDWDRPLAEQHADVQEAVKKALGEWADKHPDMGALTGEALFKRLMQEKGATVAQTEAMTGAGNKAASEALREQGLLGVQYADAATRSLPLADRVFNHVLYDPSVVKITHRNGVAVPPNSLFVDLQQMMREGASRVGETLETIHNGLPKWRTTEQIINRALADGRRDAAQMSIIRGVGQDSRSMAQFAAQLQKFQGLVTPHEREFAEAIKTHDPIAVSNTVIGNMINYIENRNTGITLNGSKLGPLADAIRTVNATIEQRMRAAHDAGLISLDEYRDNYFRHLWQDPRGLGWEGLWGGGTGRQGSGQSLRERTLPTFLDGIQAGLTPRILNPIDHTLYDLAQKTRYLTALKIIGEAKDADHAYYAFAPRNPGDKPLLGVRGEVAVDTNMVKILYGRDGYHQSYNNWLSEGMHNYPSTAGVYEKLMWAGNMSTALKLINPTFHARVVGLGSVASGIGQALEEFARGQVGWSAVHMAEAATVLPRLVTDSAIGFRGLQNFKSATDDPVLQFLAEAGLRIGPRQSIYKVGAESLTATAQRGIAEGEGIWNNTVGAGREIAKAIGRDIVAAAGNSETETALRRVVLGLPRAVALPITEMGRGMQTITAPLFDHWIPALKLGASYRRLNSWLEANPLASEEAKWGQARQIVKDVDNRYGELNQDTMFIPRVAKQIANVTLISTGWNYGSYRGFLGALGIDIERMRPAWNPTVAASTVGTIAAYALSTGLSQYLYTGHFPWQTSTPLHDLVAAHTGGITPKGAPERTTSPSELKEIFDLTKIVETGMVNPGLMGPATADYMLGKINPFFQFLHAVTTGYDGAHNDINTPGGFQKFMSENFSPMVIEQVNKLKTNSGLGMWSALLGNREAPLTLTDPAEYQRTLQNWRQRAAVQQQRRDQKTNNQLVSPGVTAPSPSPQIPPAWMRDLRPRPQR